MRPFVAAINHMTRKATIAHKARAQPYAAFAIAIWRAAMVVSMLDPDALSVLIVTYVRNPKEKCIHVVIADASPWRLCAAIYHPQTSVLLAWATFRLPYAKDFEGRSTENQGCPGRGTKRCPGLVPRSGHLFMPRLGHSFVPRGHPIVPRPGHPFVPRGYIFMPRPGHLFVPRGYIFVPRPVHLFVPTTEH